MKEKNIQEKIQEHFINAITKMPEFTSEEVSNIEKIIAVSQKSDKMAESILKSIGGQADEDT